MHVVSFSCVYFYFFYLLFSFFFFNDTATTEIYTLSLHDALPIFPLPLPLPLPVRSEPIRGPHYVRKIGILVPGREREGKDRKSTRLNSSHSQISYAVFCLKKKKKNKKKIIKIQYKKNNK